MRRHRRAIEGGDAEIEAYLARYQDKELLRFVAVGSVDDGKSTLIGRLLYDTGSVYEDQLAAARKASHMAGTDIDLSLITDGLAAEREQGITIDVAYRYFTTEQAQVHHRRHAGHVQYTRNMVTGASTATVAIMLIDARLGVLQQSRRHAYIASLLGIPHLAVCVNKMDLVSFDRGDVRRGPEGLRGVHEEPRVRQRDVLSRSARSRGPTASAAARRRPGTTDRPSSSFSTRCPSGRSGTSRTFGIRCSTSCGRTSTTAGSPGASRPGVVRKGDPVMVLPSGKTSRVKAIDVFEGERDEAFVPESVTLRLEDEIDVSRGDMLVHPEDVPRVTRTFDAHLVWLQRDAARPRQELLHQAHDADLPRQRRARPLEEGPRHARRGRRRRRSPSTRSAA